MGGTMGQALQASASGFGNAVQAGINAYSKNSGAQRDADDAMLLEKRWEMMESMQDDMVDTFKGAHEDARELFRLALRIIQEHFELRSQAVQKLTS